MSAFKPKHQRLVLVVLALVALVGAGLLAAYALRNQASYFYVPSDIASNPPEAGRAIRLGGAALLLLVGAMLALSALALV